MIQNKTIYKYKFQHFPFHLVDPSPWPILLSFSLLNLTVGAVAYMHGFTHGDYILTLGFILTTYGMILWFRGATVRFFVELHYPKIMTLYSYRREFPLTYFDRYTLPKNNSLSVKGETGTEHALDLTLEKSCQAK